MITREQLGDDIPALLNQWRLLCQFNNNPYNPNTPACVKFRQLMAQYGPAARAPGTKNNIYTPVTPAPPIETPEVSDPIPPPGENNGDMTTYIFIAAAILAAAYFIKN